MESSGQRGDEKEGRREAEWANEIKGEKEEGGREQVTEIKYLGERGEMWMKRGEENMRRQIEGYYRRMKREKDQKISIRGREESERAWKDSGRVAEREREREY